MTGTAVVVGAGVGGLATAIGLRRAGWQVSIRERRAELERYGTAFALTPAAQDALDRLGVGAAVRRRAVPYRSAQIRTPDGRVLAGLPLERLEKKAGKPELLISRPYLIDLLLAELATLGGAGVVEFGANVTDAAALQAGYDLVVGADGLRSAVRAACFSASAGPTKVGSVAWIGIADFETDRHGETWGKGRFFGLTPVEPGHTNWYAAVPEGTTAADLPGLFADWHDPIPHILTKTDPAGWLCYEMRHLHPALPTFVTAGKVALVGDAAHAMTPNLGQGACTALLDAEALTRALAHHGPGALPAALHTYDRERRRSAQRTAFASRTLHRIVTTDHTRLRNTAARLLPGRPDGISYR
ncbi:monooxygenase [Kitasatospora sp. MMS16-BH015]|uniref:FAD-dependent oxidoreductase n=1 Tax=Kitasatospora sp. MMS16-BH015 TaxID=2018025 RepID=UPI000CA39C0C|nr:NAD(P)/FAD-dependent oxidoreductase [Kitasatospora sp. MMS16-BH015]AUG79421.1 monooxygenase [Kitasatospora sp. MMS16-BH015]